MAKQIKSGFKLIHAFCRNCEFQMVPHRTNVYNLKEDVFAEVVGMHVGMQNKMKQLGHSVCAERELVVHFAPVMYEE